MDYIINPHFSQEIVTRCSNSNFGKCRGSRGEVVRERTRGQAPSFPRVLFMPFFNLVNIVHQFLTHTSGIPDYIEVRCDTDSDALSRWFRLYYAYGLMVININDFTLVSHDGGITGFRTTFYMIPEYNFGVVVMLNADNYNPGTIALRAITTYLDLPG